jgi:hypothetical protein
LTAPTTSKKRYAGKAAIWVLAVAATAFISAYASTKVADVYSDRQRAEDIRTDVATAASAAYVDAYTAAYAVATSAPRASASDDRGDRRNKVLATWLTAAAKVRVGVTVHFAGTKAARDWDGFSQAVYDLINLAYSPRIATRASLAMGVRKFLEGSTVTPPPKVQARRDAWTVLACTEPQCAGSREWHDQYRWVGRWMGLARDALILDFFHTDVKNL